MERPGIPRDAPTDERSPIAGLLLIRGYRNAAWRTGAALGRDMTALCLTAIGLRRRGDQPALGEKSHPCDIHLGATIVKVLEAASRVEVLPRLPGVRDAGVIPTARCA